MSTLKLWVDTNDALEVRSFKVHEGLSTPFEISVFVVAGTEDLDLEGIVGQKAIFSAELDGQKARFWRGVISFMEQVQAEKAGLGAGVVSTYFLRLVPKLWLTTMRRENRIFQHLSVPEIVAKL